MRWTLWAVVMLLLGPLDAVMAQETGRLPLPRFASIKADEANVRAGPGLHYPIEWVFTRRNMPVMIVGDYEHWRRIRDFEGVEGWIHRALLSGERTVIVVDEAYALRREPSFDAPMVAKIKPTVTASLDRCDDVWCAIQVQGYEGWMYHSALWGLDRDLF
jgi:Uncharacterized protein conserved in bacteria